jgi:predicted transcriptional regulator
MFKGSDREIRGAIIRALGEHATTRALLHKTLPFEKVRIDAQLERLRGEGMIILEKRSYMLPK